MVKQVHVKVGIKQLSPLFNERVTSFYITSLILSDVSMVLLWMWWRRRSPWRRYKHKAPLRAGRRKPGRCQGPTTRPACLWTSFFHLLATAAINTLLSGKLGVEISVGLAYIQGNGLERFSPESLPFPLTLFHLETHRSAFYSQSDPTGYSCRPLSYSPQAPELPTQLSFSQGPYSFSHLSQKSLWILSHKLRHNQGLPTGAQHSGPGWEGERNGQKQTHACELPDMAAFCYASQSSLAVDPSPWDILLAWPISRMLGSLQSSLQVQAEEIFLLPLRPALNYK